MCEGTVTLHEFRRGVRRLNIGINELQMDKLSKYIEEEFPDELVQENDHASSYPYQVCVGRCVVWVISNQKLC